MAKRTANVIFLTITIRCRDQATREQQAQIISTKYWFTVSLASCQSQLKQLLARSWIEIAHCSTQPRRRGWRARYNRPGYQEADHRERSHMPTVVLHGHYTRSAFRTDLAAPKHQTKFWPTNLPAAQIRRRGGSKSWALR